MKRLIIIFLSPLFLWACTTGSGSQENEAYLKNLAEENETLINLIKKKNQELDEITNYMNQIESNLAAIRRNEMEIDQLRKENPEAQQDKINSLIKEIEALVEDNKNKLALLEKQMKNTKQESAGLVRLIAHQKENVLEKEKQIQGLLTTIASLRDELNATIQAKNEEIRRKQRLIEEREATMATAYYTFGTTEQLLQDGIIRKEGGVLGAGKTYKLANRFDEKVFKKVNMTEISEIDMGIVDKKTVITTHPSDSYYFVKTSGRTYLKIVDQQKFWSVSKFLVVEAEGKL
jgi:uncharacterized protein YoxC